MNAGGGKTWDNVVVGGGKSQAGWLQIQYEDLADQCIAQGGYAESATLVAVTEDAYQRAIRETHAEHVHTPWILHRSDGVAVRFYRKDDE